MMTAMYPGTAFNPRDLEIDFEFISTAKHFSVPLEASSFHVEGFLLSPQQVLLFQYTATVELPTVPGNVIPGELCRGCTGAYKIAMIPPAPGQFSVSSAE